MQQLSWYSTPPVWSVANDPSTLHLTTASQTDFWQRTHCGFQRDNGHFYFATIATDFVMSVQVRYQPAQQYDQAGLMVRIGPECWIKAAAEYQPGSNSQLGAVVTVNGYSDWSTQDVPADLTDYRLQIRREHDTYTVAANFNHSGWMQIRLAHLPTPPGTAIDCGMYACSPNEGGMQVTFESFTIEPATHA